MSFGDILQECPVGYARSAWIHWWHIHPNSSTHICRTSGGVLLPKRLCCHQCSHCKYGYVVTCLPRQTQSIPNVFMYVFRSAMQIWIFLRWMLNILGLAMIHIHTGCLASERRWCGHTGNLVVGSSVSAWCINYTMASPPVGGGAEILLVELLAPIPFVQNPGYGEGEGGVAWGRRVCKFLSCRYNSKTYSMPPSQVHQKL